METSDPTAEWTAEQMPEAFPVDTAAWAGRFDAARRDRQNCGPSEWALDGANRSKSDREVEGFFLTEFDVVQTCQPS
jgi:hypothetical protein